MTLKELESKKEVILSIRPEYVKKIFSGEKKFEIRRRIWRDSTVNMIYIYCTFPVQKIVGCFNIAYICEAPILDIWKVVKNECCLNKKDFLSYFDFQEFGYAIKIKKPVEFSEPIDLKSISKKAPQNFCYV